MKSFFRNSQWEIDELGLIGRYSTLVYEIPAWDLTDTSCYDLYYSWPVRVAEKPWVDIEAFIEAYRVGMVLLDGMYFPACDQTKLKTSIDEARRLADSRKSLAPAYY